MYVNCKSGMKFLIAVVSRYFRFPLTYELLSQPWKPIGASGNKSCFCNQCQCTFRQITILEWNWKKSIAFQSMKFVVTKTTGFGISFWIMKCSFWFMQLYSILKQLGFYLLVHLISPIMSIYQPPKICKLLTEINNDDKL